MFHFISKRIRKAGAVILAGAVLLMNAGPALCATEETEAAEIAQEEESSYAADEVLSSSAGEVLSSSSDETGTSEEVMNTSDDESSDPEDEVLSEKQYESYYYEEETLSEEAEIPLDADIESDTASSLADPDILLERYLYDGGDIQQRTAPAEGKKRLFAARKSSLPEASRQVYTILLEEIRKIAAGERSDTVIEISASEFFGDSTYSFTADDLGVSSLCNEAGTALSEEATAALKSWCQDAGYLPSSVMNSLIADVPYELYWLDKTLGFKYSIYPSLFRNSSFTQITIKPESVIRFRLPVAAAYTATGLNYLTDEYGNALTDASGRYERVYETDLTKTAAVPAAMEQASVIVNEASGMSDYEKLLYYKNSICSLTDYNYEAANTYQMGTPYGDPWQIVYVFDGDSSTKVVCEGYSKAMKYLCDLTDFNAGNVDCYLMTGTVSGLSNGDHMWNVIQMSDGKNYLTDITNCDTARSRIPFLAGVEDVSSLGYTFKVSSSQIVYRYDAETCELYTETERTIGQNDYYRVNPDGSVAASYLLMSDDAVIMTEGDTAALSASVYPEEATDQSVTWENSNVSVVSVAPADSANSQSTVISAGSPGSAVIRAISGDGSCYAECRVTVMAKPVPVTGVSVSKKTLSLKKGKTYMLTANVLPSNADTPTVRWKSSNASVASVASDGTVTAKAAGTASITAVTDDGGYTASCKVTVTLPKNGLAQDANGRWCYYKNDVINKNITGLYRNTSTNKWYLIVNGVHNKSFTGVAWSTQDQKWYFAKNGTRASYTGIVKSIKNGKWYFVRAGVLDWKFTGVAKSIKNGKWYFIRKGLLDKSFTGIAKSVKNGKWYFVRKGLLDKSFTGGAKSAANGRWYYVKKGLLDRSFNGRAKGTDGKYRRYVNGTAV